MNLPANNVRTVSSINTQLSDHDSQLLGIKTTDKKVNNSNNSITKLVRKFSDVIILKHFVLSVLKYLKKRFSPMFICTHLFKVLCYPLLRREWQTF